MKKIYTIFSSLFVAAIATAQVSVTYQVDITDYLAAGNVLGANGIRIGGNFTTVGAEGAIPDWSPSAAECAMTDLGGNIWSITVTYPTSAIGTEQLYKFVNNDWGTNEGSATSEIATGGCGLDDGSGNINRSLIIPDASIGYQFCWEKCTRCDGSDAVLAGIFDITPSYTPINVYPNPATDLTVLNFTLSQPSEVTFEIYNVTGQMVKSEISNFNYSGPAVYDLNVSELNTGIYMVVVTENTNKMIATLSVN